MTIEDIKANREYTEDVFNDLIIQINNNNLSQKTINPDDYPKFTSKQQEVLQSIKRAKNRIIK